MYRIRLLFRSSMMSFFTVLAKKKPKKDIYTTSVTKAFKPIVDILEALLKGMKPFIIILTAVAVVIQLLKAFQHFQRGEGYQKQVYAVITIIFCATLIMTYNSWLIPILKSVAGM